MFHDSFLESCSIAPNNTPHQTSIDPDETAIINEEEPTSVTPPTSTTSFNSSFIYIPPGSTKQRCCIPTIVTLPKALTVIGLNAFRDCDRLTTVNFPPFLTTIETNAFRGCNQLTNVVLPDSITSIGSGAFRDCALLTDIILPTALDALAMDAFVGCTGLWLRLFADGDWSMFPLEGLEGALLKAGFLQTRLTDLLPMERDDPPENDGPYYDPAPHTSTNTTPTLLTAGFLQTTTDLLPMERDGPYYDPTPHTSTTTPAYYYHPTIHWSAAARQRSAQQGRRLPLSRAAAHSLPWVELQQIFAAYMPAIGEEDGLTGLFPFMLAAVGGESCLESVYWLLREFPGACGVGFGDGRLDGIAGRTCDGVTGGAISIPEMEWGYVSDACNATTKYKWFHGVFGYCIDGEERNRAGAIG